MQAVGHDAQLHTLPFPVVVAGEVKQVRSPGPAHPHMVVPTEVRDSSRDGCFTFPPVAVYCQPPSPTLSAASSAASPSSGGREERRSAGSEWRGRAAVGDERAPVKRPVCARLSVPTDGAPWRRRRVSDDDDDGDGGGLSRSNSHPLHRHRGRSRPDDDLDNGS